MRWKTVSKALVLLAAAGVGGPLAVLGYRELVNSPDAPFGRAPEIRATQVLRPVGTPKLEVEENRYNFGTLDVEQAAEHDFVLRNVGDGDLLLRLGESSCKCTRGELSETKVPPLGEARVRLVWQPPKPAEVFAQGVTVHTNDLARPSIYLHVVGSVRIPLAASEEEVLLKAPLNEAASRSVLIYSQAWDAFEIEAECEHPLLTIQTRPAREEELTEFDARAGYQVQVHMPAGLALGEFASELRMRAIPADESAARSLTLPIHGVVSSRVKVQGPGLEDGNRLDLGTVWRGDSKRIALAMFVRGEHADLVVDPIRCQPASLKVSVGPREKVSEQLSRYKLEIEVPADAHLSQHLGRAPGEIALTTNHPDAPELRWSVFLAVLEKP